MTNTRRIIFSQLEEQRDDIEQALGFGVTWMPLPTKQACRIICHKDNCPLDALTRWDEYQNLDDRQA